MTIKALATACGISYNYAKLLEHGAHQPSDLFLGKLARGLGCHVHDLTRPAINRSAA